jgi:hypothetical protein
MTDSEYDQQNYDRGQREGASGKEWNGRSTDPSSPYNKGYNHGKGQRDGYNNEHSSYRSGNSQYESGWSSGSSSSGSATGGGSGGCFITTATLSAIGKSDDCPELSTLRAFRDNWLAKQENGKNLISDYYHYAPEIVKAIDSRQDYQEIYSLLWEQCIQPCLRLIKDGRNEEAKAVYSKTVIELKNRFLSK